MSMLSALCVITTFWQGHSYIMKNLSEADRGTEERQPEHNHLFTRIPCNDWLELQPSRRAHQRCWSETEQVRAGGRRVK